MDYKVSKLVHCQRHVKCPSFEAQQGYFFPFRDFRFPLEKNNNQDCKMDRNQRPGTALANPTCKKTAATAVGKFLEILQCTAVIVASLRVILKYSGQTGPLQP